MGQPIFFPQQCYASHQLNIGSWQRLSTMVKVASPKLCLHRVYHATDISICTSATQEYPGIAAGVLLSNTCNSQTMSWLNMCCQGGGFGYSNLSRFSQINWVSSCKTGGTKRGLQLWKLPYSNDLAVVSQKLHSDWKGDGHLNSWD